LVATQIPSGSPFCDMPRIAACNLSDPSVKTMDGSGVGQKHERALSGDHLNSQLLAELNGFVADRALATCTVHPDNFNASFNTIVYHGVGRFWRSHEQCRSDRRMDVLHAREAFPSVNLLCTRIHRHDVITALA